MKIVFDNEEQRVSFFHYFALNHNCPERFGLHGYANTDKCNSMTSTCTNCWKCAIESKVKKHNKKC